MLYAGGAVLVLAAFFVVAKARTLTPAGVIQSVGSAISDGAAAVVNGAAEAAAPILDPVTVPVANWWVNLWHPIVEATTPEERRRAHQNQLEIPDNPYDLGASL